MENEIEIELFEEFPELLYNIRVIPYTLSQLPSHPEASLK